MKIILVPGFWLDGSSWSDVSAVLEAAGNEVEEVTLPGLESVSADRAAISLADHVAAVVARIDASDEPVVLVGHSGAAAVVAGAADLRAERVARVIYVDTWPTAEGLAVNPALPTTGGEIPLPSWEAFREDNESDLDDLDAADLEAFRARAIPHPARAARDTQHYTDEARLDVPATIIGTTFTKAVLDGFIEQDHPVFREVALLRELTVVELPTGHWPQFSKPTELGELIVQQLG